MGGNGTLILLRHGQSTANAEGRFTGVLDVPLTPSGIAEAHHAAALLNAASLAPEIVLTSTLRRARDTAAVVTTDLLTPPQQTWSDWRVNERNYGSLTGQFKTDVVRQFGYQQFIEWRRSVDSAPPPMSEQLYGELLRVQPFSTLPAEALTRTESLSDVISRVNAFHVDTLLPLLKEDTCVLLVAHGNSLRALCVVLDGLDAQAVGQLNVPTGQPLVYRFGPDHKPAPAAGTYLDEVNARAAAIALAREGGT